MPKTELKPTTRSDRKFWSKIFKSAQDDTGVTINVSILRRLIADVNRLEAEKLESELNDIANDTGGL